MKKIIFFMIIFIALNVFLFQVSAESSKIPNNITGRDPNNPDMCKLYLESQASTPINIVFLGDGFTANDIRNGLYDRKVAEIMNNFFYVPVTEGAALRSFFSQSSISTPSSTSSQPEIMALVCVKMVCPVVIMYRWIMINENMAKEPAI